MKTCCRCGVPKPIDQFNRSPKNRDGAHSYCRACQSQHYRDNRERHMRNVRRTERARRLRFRLFLLEHMEDGCVDCGEMDIRVLQFDHVRGTKVAAISDLMKNSSFARLRAEVAKCDVRCANCHAIQTLERRGGSWHDPFLRGPE